MAKSISLEELQNYNFGDNEETERASGKEHYKNYSKDIAVTLGYLLGVKEEHLRLIPNTEDDYQRVITDKVSQNEAAQAIRYLNQIRSSIILEIGRAHV